MRQKLFIKILLIATLSFVMFYFGFRKEDSKIETSGEIFANIDTNFEPAYLKLHRSGGLKRQAEALWQMMQNCRLCPRMCGVNRLKGKVGFCGAPGVRLYISSYHPHFGEERPLVGRGGSGTIFFTHCNLRCIFCQNWAISHLGRGEEAEIERLARMMLKLQEMGCHNINLVTPTHYSAHILKALDIACSRGLRLPIVWNTSGWERLEILKILDGIVDIYMAQYTPQFKAFDYPEISRRITSEEYERVVRRAKELGLTNLDIRGYWWLR